MAEAGRQDVRLRHPPEREKPARLKKILHFSPSLSIMKSFRSSQLLLSSRRQRPASDRAASAILPRFRGMISGNESETRGKPWIHIGDYGKMKGGTTTGRSEKERAKKAAGQEAAAGRKEPAERRKQREAAEKSILRRARYDAVCKRLLSERIILGWMMRECLEEFRGCSPQEIAANYIEDGVRVGDLPLIYGIRNEDVSQEEGTVFYDIRFLANAPSGGERIRLIVNVEAQNEFYPGYPLIKRGIYYGSRLICAQYGTEFTGSHYEKIKKVYSIWICTGAPKKRRGSITEYAIGERNRAGCVREQKEHYDLMTVIQICLGEGSEKESAGAGGKLPRLLELLLVSDRPAEEKKAILQEEYQIPMTQSIEGEVEKMCNLSQGIENRGIRKGRQEGIREGRREGRREEREELLKNLMKTTGWSLKKSMEALKISSEEEERLKKLLEEEPEKDRKAVLQKRRFEV